MFGDLVFFNLVFEIIWLLEFCWISSSHVIFSLRLPMSIVLRDVLGHMLSGNLCSCVTATDLVLTGTQMLRKCGVGKFVELYGTFML